MWHTMIGFMSTSETILGIDFGIIYESVRLATEIGLDLSKHNLEIDACFFN